jgi:hypothetical protein
MDTKTKKTIYVNEKPTEVTIDGLCEKILESVKILKHIALIFNKRVDFLECLEKYHEEIKPLDPEQTAQLYSIVIECESVLKLNELVFSAIEKCEQNNYKIQ